MARRIALVEDDPTIRQNYVDALTRAGYEVAAFGDGASARLRIIFLSARDSDFDIVVGLRLGADDYLTKDVSLPHLLARISALFRRVDATSQPAAMEDVLNRGKLALDAQRMTATWNG